MELIGQARTDIRQDDEKRGKGEGRPPIRVSKRAPRKKRHVCGN